MLLKSRALVNYYMQALVKRPLTTKILTSGTIAFVSDVVCQQLFPQDLKRGTHSKVTHRPRLPPHRREKVEDGHKEEVAYTGTIIDWDRTLRFTFINSTYVPIALHFWYGFLFRTIASWPLRVFCDQFFFSPVSLSIFFSLNTFLIALQQQQPIRWWRVVLDIWRKLEVDLPQTMIVNWLVWIPAMSINFSLVPQPLQVLFANGVGIFWNMFLSSKAAKKGGEGRK